MCLKVGVRKQERGRDCFEPLEVDEGDEADAGAAAHNQTTTGIRLAVMKQFRSREQVNTQCSNHTQKQVVDHSCCSQFITRIGGHEKTHLILLAVRICSAYCDGATKSGDVPSNIGNDERIWLKALSNPDTNFIVDMD